MQNLTASALNATRSSDLPVIIKVCAVVPFFCVYLFFVAVMLHIFACERRFLEASRYALFASMLVNDSLHLLSSVLLFLLVMGRVKFAGVFCFPLLFVSTATFWNTPLVLASMSLERYVAIFYPLRRPWAWRSERVWVSVLCPWLVSCAVLAPDYAIGRRRPALRLLATPVLCKDSAVNSSPAQMLYKAAVNVLFFAAVAALILFTYVRILLETRKLRRDGASVSRALRTVLLHGLQLLLCMLAFSHPITEGLIVLHSNWLPQDIAFFNYFCFMLVPRFLSPLIYGFRDQMLRGHLKKNLLCRSKRFTPKVRDSRQP